MNLDLTGLADITRPSLGEPLMLSLGLISRDPDQPRKYFDEEALKELAESIRANGVVQPISVRPAPAAPGRYIINYGERRFLASLIAGLISIPVFVHKTPDDYTQVNENLHRADLSPMEMALFIKRRLDAGEKRNEIATRLGYMKSYVTEHLALLESPPCVEKAYANGVASARTLYDLRRLHDEFPEQVDAWIASGALVTRDTIVAFGEKVRHDELAQNAATPSTSSYGTAATRDTTGSAAEEVCHDELAQNAATSPTFSDGTLATRDTIRSATEKVRHDELAQNAATPSTSSNGARVTRDLVAASTEKVRHDELAQGAATTPTSSNGMTTPNTIATSPEKVRHDELAQYAATVSTSPSEALLPGRRATTDHERTDCAAAARPLPRRLRIKVNHGGRNALIDDDSIVRLRYDDGDVTDVRLADAIVLAAVAV